MQVATDNGCFTGTTCFFAYDCSLEPCAEVDVTNIYRDISDAEYEVCKQQFLQLVGVDSP
jgi:hypothetical protein